jgi:hypothetical protein
MNGAPKWGSAAHGSALTASEPQLGQWHVAKPVIGRGAQVSVGLVAARVVGAHHPLATVPLVPMWGAAEPFGWPRILPNGLAAACSADGERATGRATYHQHVARLERRKPDFLLLVVLLILFLLRSDRLLLVAGALSYFAFGSDIGLRDHVRLLRFIWHMRLLSPVSPEALLNAGHGQRLPTEALSWALGPRVATPTRGE